MSTKTTVKKGQKSFTAGELQAISNSCSVLKTCDGVQPFSLANKINACGKATDAAIKICNEELALIREREQNSSNPEKFQMDIQDLLSKKYPIDTLELKEAEFNDLEISGNKSVPQQDGSVREFSYRDAYFSLVNMGLID